MRDKGRLLHGGKTLEYFCLENTTKGRHGRNVNHREQRGCEWESYRQSRFLLCFWFPNVPQLSCTDFIRRSAIIIHCKWSNEDHGGWRRFSSSKAREVWVGRRCPSPFEVEPCSGPPCPAPGHHGQPSHKAWWGWLPRRPCWILDGAKPP